MPTVLGAKWGQGNNRFFMSKWEWRSWLMSASSGDVSHYIIREAQCWEAHSSRSYITAMCLKNYPCLLSEQAGERTDNLQPLSRRCICSDQMHLGGDQITGGSCQMGEKRQVREKKTKTKVHRNTLWADEMRAWYLFWSSNSSTRLSVMSSRTGTFLPP